MTAAAPSVDVPTADFEVAPEARASRGACRLPPSALRELSRLSPGRALGHVALEWGAIAAAIAICESFWHPLLYLAAVVWIGSRQHALAVMAHDGTHYLILRNKRWNDAVTRLLLAWPVGMSLESYRPIHRAHHRYLNSERDPDWARNRPDRLAHCRRPAEFARVMLGLSAEQRQLAGLFGASGGVSRGVTALRVAYYAAIGIAAYALGWWPGLLLYWVVPLVTWFAFSMRLKGTAEHFAVEDAEACNASRTLLPGRLERLLLAPKNVHYHIEHHLYPSVPFYRLADLHDALLGDRRFRERAHLTRTYRQFLRECLAESALAGEGGSRGAP